MTGAADLPGWALAALGATTAAALLFALLYLRLRHHLRRIATGFALLREQDNASRLRPTGSQAVDKAIELFNSMMAHLRSERLRIQEQEQLFSLVVEAAPMAVRIYDFDRRRVTMQNSAAERIIDPRLAAILAAMEPGETRVVRLSGSEVYRCSVVNFRERGFARPFEDDMPRRPGAARAGDSQRGEKRRRIRGRRLARR